MESYLVITLIDGIKDYKISNGLKEKIDTCLANLVKNLNDLEVKTTTDLLKEAKLIKNKYTVKFVDDKKLRLVNQKYIDVELKNGYKETLLQDHNIGSKSYDISVYEKTKNFAYKPLKSM